MSRLPFPAWSARPRQDVRGVTGELIADERFAVASPDDIERWHADFSERPFKEILRSIDCERRHRLTAAATIRTNRSRIPNSSQRLVERFGLVAEGTAEGGQNIAPEFEDGFRAEVCTGARQ